MRLLLRLLWALAAAACLAAPDQAVAQGKTEPPGRPTQTAGRSTQAAAARTRIRRAIRREHRGSHPVHAAHPQRRHAHRQLHRAPRSCFALVPRGQQRRAAGPGLLQPCGPAHRSQRRGDPDTQASPAAAIDQNKRLHISGFFPGEPVQLNFDLIFEVVANQWRLFGISVNPTRSATAETAAPAASPSPPPPPGADKKKRRPTRQAREVANKSTRHPGPAIALAARAQSRDLRRAVSVRNPGLSRSRLQPRLGCRTGRKLAA